MWQPRSGSERPRVVHVCGGTLTGCSRVVLNLLAGHDRRRVDPAALFFAVLPPDREVTDAVTRMALPWESVVKRSRYDVTAIPRFAAALRRLRAEVVVLHGFSTYTFGVVAARLAGARRLVRVEHAAELHTRLHRLASRAAAPLVDSTISVSHYLLEYLRENGVTLRRPEVIYNGIDLSSFERITRAPFSTAGPPTVLMTARLDVPKDHATLLDAMALLARRGTRLRLLLAGAGPLQAVLVAQARRLGLSADVEFLGHQEDIVSLVERADIGVLTTEREGFGLAVVEAMAGARPVVATGVSALPELVDPGVEGYLVPPRSPEALAEALASLVANPERARAMGLAGLARARDRFALAPSVLRFEAHLLNAGAVPGNK